MERGGLPELASGPLGSLDFGDHGRVLRIRN